MTRLSDYRAQVVTFDHARDNHPKPMALDEEQLWQRLVRFTEHNVDDKSRLPAWSPCVYEDGAKRGNAGVLFVTMLVLDVDDGTPIMEMVRRFEDVGPLYWHTSWSFTPAHPKYRIVIPLEEPVRAGHWSRVFKWAQDRAGGHLDPSAKDPARLWFWPAVPPGAPVPESGLWGEKREVFSIDAEALPATEEEQQQAQSKAPVRRRRVPRGVKPSALLRDLQARLKAEPAMRRRVAELVDAKITEGPNAAAKGIACPGCGRPSVWFLLSPVRWAGAECDHRNSCGWHGWLDELVDFPGLAA